METRQRPSWDTYFIGMAKHVATRSPDEKRQVGCVLVNADRRIVGTGYNGTPSGFDDSAIDWQGDDKHSYVIHAEVNALLHTNGLQTRGGTLYCTDSPCPDCAKLIASAGVSRVVYERHYSSMGIFVLHDFGIPTEQIGGNC